MAREKAKHIRTKNPTDAPVFCGADKIERFAAGLESVGPKAKGGTCAKCIKNRDRAAAAKAGE